MSLGTSPVNYLYEHDIDLLLVEEFATNSDFCQWFLNKVAANTNGLNSSDQKLAIESNLQEYIATSHEITFDEIYHSTTKGSNDTLPDESGETDILAIYKNEKGRKWFLLIENKIDAQLQPKQAERYLARGKNLIKTDPNSGYLTLMVAPKKYFGVSLSLFGFQSYISFEMLEEWFNGTNTLKGKYRASLLKTACEKAAYSNERIKAFFKSYDELLQARLPELKISLGNRVSTWLTYKLPKNASANLMHKTEEGYVDLHYAGMGDKLEELRKRFNEFELSGRKIKDLQTGKSGTLRINVPKLNPLESFELQKEEAYQGMVAALRLTYLYEAETKNRVIPSSIK